MGKGLARYLAGNESGSILERADYGKMREQRKAELEKREKRVNEIERETSRWKKLLRILAN